MTLDTYEQSLLTELRRHVAERSPAPDRRRAGRRWWIAAPVGAAGAAAAAFFALAPSAAYAVTEEHGDLVVLVHRLDDAEGLEQALAEHGITAEVEYDATVVPGPPLDDGEPVAEDESVATGGGAGFDTEGSSETGVGVWEGDEPLGDPMFDVALSEDTLTVRIYDGELPDDSVLHITTGGSAEGVAGLQVELTESD
ncbi:hypothetical protein GCM10027059_37500 [Myceligenerans halotolerans]